MVNARWFDAPEVRTSWEQSFDRSLVKVNLSNAVATRRDTNTPDSLGDQMFRACLQYSYKLRNGELTDEFMEEMKKLQARHDAGE